MPIRIISRLDTENTFPPTLDVWLEGAYLDGEVVLRLTPCYCIKRRLQHCVPSPICRK